MKKRVVRNWEATVVATVALGIFTFAFAQVGEWEPERNLAIGNTNTPNYTVVKGDCLWDLAQTHLGDPFLWRRIWEHNRWIEDPHWIFPGNMLFIPGIMTELAIVPAAEITLLDTAKSLTQMNREFEQQDRIRDREFLPLFEMFRYHVSLTAQMQTPFAYEYKRDSRGRVRQTTRFQGDGAIRSLGNVVIRDGSPFIRQHQNATVKITSDREARGLVRVGAELGFFAPRTDIPCENGIVVQPVAVGTVRSIDGNNATIFAQNVWGRLPDGAIAASVRTPHLIGTSLTYRVLSDSLKTKTIARLSPDTPIKPFETLFIDKGSRNGVAVGDHIIFSPSAQARTRSGRDSSQETLVVLEGLVVAVEAGTATVKVTTVSDLTTSNSLAGVRIGRIVSRN